MDILTSLNESQRKAVADYEGAALVIAGAGSGKTRVLTYRIAYMLSKGVQPWNVLALTFTNKAAGEMRERIETLVGHESAERLWMGTFHSIFARILRREAPHLNLRSDFTIYDATDSRSLIKTIVKEMGLDEKIYKPASVAKRISGAKNALVTPEQYAQNSRYVQHDQASRMAKVYEIYQRYAARCRQSNALDFDDLLLLTYKLFFDCPDVCAKYERQFQYVLVDEYQDTNFAQHQIVWLLTRHSGRLCVVGDDAQSIYSFRGANIDNILRFQQQYPQAKLFKLERNYRSTKNIVEAANSLIRHNRQQIEKHLYSENGEGEKVEVVHLTSDFEEAGMVAKRILRMNGRDHIPFGDIAVLYRTNNQSRQIEEALRRENIPYIIYGGLSFYQRKEIKDIMAYQRLAVNLTDEEALRRVVNYPARGIGETTLGKVFAAARLHEVSPMAVLADPLGYHLEVRGGTVEKLTSFAQMIKSFHDESTQLDAESLTRTILTKSGMAADINHGAQPDDISRQENMQEFLNALSAFVLDHTEQEEPCFLADFLQEVSLMSDLDTDQPATEEGTVTLMTVHSAKGLEFRVVFVVGLEEGLFPNQMAIDDEHGRGIEEERRLMYVAMTRASEILVLTSCENRFRFGKSDSMEPSRFLAEIDPQFTRVEGKMMPRWSEKTYTPKPMPSSVWGKTLRRVSHSATTPASPAPQTEANGLKVGMKVSHARFGEGEIISIEGSGVDAKARVRFAAGEKQLLLKYARLTPLGE